MSEVKSATGVSATTDKRVPFTEPVVDLSQMDLTSQIVDLVNSDSLLLQDLNDLVTKFTDDLSKLDKESQHEFIKDKIKTALAQIDDILSNETDLTSDDIVALSALKDALQELSAMVDDVYSQIPDETVGNQTSFSATRQQAAAFATDGQMMIYFSNLDITGLSAFGANGPVTCYLVMLWMMTGPLSRVMNNYSAQVAELGQEGDVVNKTLSDFLTPIATWAAQNSELLTPAGSSAINLFDAFYAWLDQNDPNSPYLGTLDNGGPSPIDQSFGTSSTVNSVFQTMYRTMGTLNDKLNTMFGTTGVIYLTIGDMVNNGDTAIYSAGTQLVPPTIPDNPDSVSQYGQQLFMTALTQPANAAGLAINGLTSTPIFPPSSWSQGSATDPTATWDPASSTPFSTESTNSTSLFYNVGGGGTGTPASYQFFFTMNSINTMIGNNQSSGSGTSPGAISSCLKSQTTVGTTNALLTGALSMYSTTYANYTSSLQTILPTLSIKG